MAAAPQPRDDPSHTLGHMTVTVMAGGRTVDVSELGGMADVAARYGVKDSTMATIANRARARGDAPTPVCRLRRGDLYVVADWEAVIGARRAAA